jgi:hypothetical protein
MGRSEVNVLGGAVSFFGFLAILLLRCSPLAMVVPWIDIPAWEGLDVKAQSRKFCGFVAVSKLPAMSGRNHYLTSVTNWAVGRRTFFSLASQSPSAAR